MSGLSADSKMPGHSRTFQDWEFENLDRLAPPKLQLTPIFLEHIEEQKVAA